MLTDMVSVFGEDSDQARQADERYVSAAANYHREHYWEKYCSTEGLGSLSAACTIVDTVVYLRYKLGGSHHELWVKIEDAKHVRKNLEARCRYLLE